MAPPKPGRWEIEGRFERNCLNVGGAGGETRSLGMSVYCNSSSSPSNDLVLRVEALRLEF